MTLAEALQERADLKRTVSELKGRIQNNATVQEGEEAIEEPMELLKQFNSSLKKLEDLTIRINLTNTNTFVEGQSLTALIARRDTLKEKIQCLQQLANAASATGNRYSRSEIKTLPTVSVKDIRKQIDTVSKELRLLDNKIQMTNWSTELQ